jgi:transglutaminase-like putative cysteine protease
MRVAGALLAALVLARPLWAGGDAPAWLQAAAAAPLPSYDAKARAVVLLDEGELVVEPGGKVRRVSRYALKVLREDGRTAATVSVSYGTDARKIASLDAWRISSSGKIRKYGKAETEDVALSPADVYNEARARVISARAEAETGDVFGYEVVTEERPLFAQDIWFFQETFPVRVSRYTLSLPPGWRAEGRVFNHAELPPEVAGSRYVWEMRDLPFIDAEEPLSPPFTRLAPRLAVSFFPAAGADAGFSSFAAWGDVSRWYASLAGPQAEASDALVAKAKELTANATGDVEKVRAIARYVQSTNYIAVQIGLGRFRPHAAAEVLAKSYGDCKDKANLMKALLQAVGLESHLVLVYSGDPLFVREEWPSPWQFNHCILAVRMPAALPFAAALEDPSLGRLLFFDPTDPHTLVGDLPAPEQGSWALVAAGESGRLLRLPTAPPEARESVRSVEASLNAEGDLTAAVREISVGQAAAAQRALFASSQTDLARRLDAWVARGSASAKVGSVKHEDDPTTGRFTLDLELSAPRYAQPLQRRLLLFRPVILNRKEWVLPSAAARTQPMELDDEAFSESMQLALPAGFAADELPPPVAIEAAFGSYSSKAQAAGGRLTFTRRYTLRRTTVPAEEHAAVRAFFEKIKAAEGAQVVLVRTP